MTTERLSLTEIDIAVLSVLDRVETAALSWPLGDRPAAEAREIARAVGAINDQLLLHVNAPSTPEPSALPLLRAIRERVDETSALVADLLHGTAPVRAARRADLKAEAARSTGAARPAACTLHAADRITEDAMQILYTVRQDLRDAAGPDDTDLDDVTRHVDRALGILRDVATDLRAGPGSGEPIRVGGA